MKFGSLPRPHPRPKLTLKQRLRAWAIALLVFLVIPLFVVWLIVCQPSLKRNSPSNARVDPAHLEATVRRLSIDRVPRDFAHRDNLARIADEIEAAFAESGARPRRHTYRHTGLYQFHNISGFFGPEDETLPRVIVGAHYDTYDEFPGADDNASGVAGILELATLLGKLEPSRFVLPVELVCWPLEEPPYFRSDGMGSAVHAASLRENGVPVRLMVCLEMIGYFSDTFGSQSYPMPLLHLYYPERGNFVAVAGDLHNRESIALAKAAMKGATPMPVCSIAAPRNLPGIDFSDHLNFWDQGYPAIMITDTAFYRNDRYHTERDTPDTLDYERMAQVVVGVYEVIRSLTVAN
ncbi:MAG: M28 family peptidase [Verrucomicrobiae bacterium]|nr:M28 family peptidase [Verrucomicrobiae bacterium]